MGFSSQMAFKWMFVKFQYSKYIKFNLNIKTLKFAPKMSNHNNFVSLKHFSHTSLFGYFIISFIFKREKSLISFIESSHWWHCLLFPRSEHFQTKYEWLFFFGFDAKIQAFLFDNVKRHIFVWF